MALNIAIAKETKQTIFKNKLSEGLILMKNDSKNKKAIMDAIFSFTIIDE